MPCHPFIELKVDDYLTGRLTPDDKRHFDDIIGQCLECRRFLDEQRAAYDLVHEVSRPETPELYWSELENSILARIESSDIQTINEIATDDARPHGIWNMLIPLAASFLIFLVSLSMGDKVGNIAGSEPAAANTFEINAAQTSYANLIESPEIIAISYIAASPPGTFGF
jgi:hypothetical protein